MLGRYIRGGFGKKEWLGKLLKHYLQCDHVDSRESHLPLTRDYFEALILENPKSASSPLRIISRIVDRVGTGTEGISLAGAGAFDE